MTRLARPASFVLLISIVILLSLSACQGDASTAQEGEPYGDLEQLDPDDTLVVYWHSLTGADRDLLLELIDDFNAGNAWNITVVGEYLGDAQALYERIMAGLDTGKLPNLVMSTPDLVATFAAQDAVLALSPYLESRKWGLDDLDDFYPGALASERLPQFKDELFSFPTCYSLRVLYYNLDWLKELGYDALPQDWEEMGQMLCDASDPVDGLYGYKVGLDSATFIDLLATRGAGLLNRNGTAYTLGGQQGRAVLQFLQTLIQEGCASWDPEVDPLDDFSAGRVLLAVDSTDRLSEYRRAVAENAGFEWTLTTLPHLTEEPVVGVYGNGLAILRSTPQEQLAAWLFVRWLAEPEQQVRWVRQATCFPTRKSALVAMEPYLAERPEYNLAAQLLESEWATAPGVTGFAACRAEIGRMLYAVTAGDSVDQWLEETQERCNQALDEALGEASE